MLGKEGEVTDASTLSATIFMAKNAQANSAEDKFSYNNAAFETGDTAWPNWFSWIKKLPRSDGKTAFANPPLVRSRPYCHEPLMYALQTAQTTWT